ncbi:MAG TPA: molybdenum cofactor guanylyltransferase [Candidatus Limnocylindrales bacterium]
MTGERIVGIVLAGGASTRFGGDKLAAMLHGRPLLHHAVEAVGAVAGHVIVVIGPDADEPQLPASVAGRSSIARDAASNGGPLQGLAAGLTAIPAVDGEAAPPVVLVAGGDMPTLHPGVLGLLAATLATDPTIVALTLEDPDGAPLPMAVRPVVLPTAISLLQDNRRSLRALLDAVPRGAVPATAWRALDPGARTLRDVDTEADLDIADA